MGMEIKKVQGQDQVQPGSNQPAPAENPAERPAEETSLLDSIWDATKTGYRGFADGVQFVKDNTGWTDLTAAQDRADGRVELWTKETNGLGYVPALLGNVAAQPTDVVSYTGEKITEQTEKVDSAVADLAPEQVTTSGEQAQSAGVQFLQSVASPVKLLNGILNIGGGTSDIVSHGLKGGSVTNDMITQSTERSQGEIAASLQDFSLDNINDKKTLIDVGTRLGMSQEQLEAYEAEHGTDGVRELIRREYDSQRATGKISRETVLVTAANGAQQQLVDKNADLLVHQFDPGVQKLDKGQLQLRQATSELLNAPAAVLDLTNTGIHAGVEAIAGETAADIVDAPLQFVSGTLQVFTTSWDGKEGTTEAALEKMTFGLYKKDTPEEAAHKAEVARLEDDLDAKQDAVDTLSDELDDLREQHDEAANGTSGFFGIGAKAKDEVRATELQTQITAKETQLYTAQAHALIAQLALATKENDADDIEEANQAIAEFEAAHPGLLAQVRQQVPQAPAPEAQAPAAPEAPAAQPQTLADVQAQFKADADAKFQQQKVDAITSPEAVQSRAEETVSVAEQRALAPILAQLETEPRATRRCADLMQQLADTQARLRDNHDKAVAAVAAKFTPEVMQQRLTTAEAEAAELAAGGHTSTWDAQRLAQRAENAGVARREDGTTNEALAAFWNEMDKAYSNSDNTAGAIGALDYAWHFVKGAGLTIPSALLTEGVSTVDKYIGTLGCFKVAAIASAYNAAKKGGEAVDEIVSNPYNSAAQRSGAAKGGEAAVYATASALTFVYGNHNHLIRPHFKGWCCEGSGSQGGLPPVVNTPCDDLLTNPGALAGII